MYLAWETPTELKLCVDAIESSVAADLTPSVSFADISPSDLTPSVTAYAVTFPSLRFGAGERLCWLRAGTPTAFVVSGLCVPVHVMMVRPNAKILALLYECGYFYKEHPFKWSTNWLNAYRFGLIVIIIKQKALSVKPVFGEHGHCPDYIHVGLTELNFLLDKTRNRLIIIRIVSIGSFSLQKG